MAIMKFCACGADITYTHWRRKKCTDCAPPKKQQRLCAEDGCEADITGKTGRNARCETHAADRKRKGKNAQKRRARHRNARWPDCIDCGVANPGRYRRCEACRNGERECVEDGCRETTGPGLSRCPEHVSERELYTAYTQAWQRANPLKCQYWARRRAARKRGLEFTITLEEVRALFPADRRCPVCRAVMEHGAADPATSPSIDRIDNTGGYVPGQVQIICLGCNGRKTDLTLAQLSAGEAGEDWAAWARAYLAEVAA
jgi:hypothetical protein